jgi:polyhydroxyalkanoate synthesis regulator phasin
MFELFKKTITTGLGAMLLTRDKVEELLKDLVEQGRISQKEAEEIIDELVSKAEKDKEEAKDKVKKEVGGILDKAGFGKSKEITELKEEVRNLSLEIEALKEEISDLRKTKEKESGNEELISEVND